MTHEDIFTFTKDEETPLKRNFVFSCIGLAHSHIYGMTNSLIKAGAELKWVYDDNADLLQAYSEKYPQAKAASSIEEVLEDSEVDLIVSADIPSRRAGLAIRSMEAGHHFFVDKAPAITLDQCTEVQKAREKTGMKYFVYYSELIENDATIFAKQLVERGVIGRIYHLDIFAPHRLNPESRPDWFWKRADTGGIITDIGSHQIEQFLEFAGSTKAKITSARVANYFHPQYPEFDDFGDFMIESDNGITGYMRVDWMSPAGIKTFGDLRLTILGEKGFIEIRKNCDLGHSSANNNVTVAIDDGVFSQSVSGKIDKPYFKRLINDCINGTDTAMSPELIRSAMELTVTAQNIALKK